MISSRRGPIMFAHALRPVEPQYGTSPANDPAYAPQAMRRRAKPIAWTIPSILSSSGKRWRITAVKRPGRSLSIRPTSSFIWSRVKATRCVMALASAGLGFCGRGSRPSRQSANGPIGPRRRKCSHATPTCRDSCRAASIITRRARALSRLQPLPHPWLERAVDYRNQRVVRLRPHAQ